MIFKRNASDFMTDSVIVANTKNIFQHVMDFFIQFKIQHLPVEENGKLIGILSIKNVLHFIQNQLQKNQAIDTDFLNQNFKVCDVMTPNPVSVEPYTSQKEILEILSEGKFQSVPIVLNGEIKGIITNKDITKIYHYDATHFIP